MLKSLSVWVASGTGTIGALAFEKPEDPTIALDERSLNLPLGSSMYALLGAFRGRVVAIESGGVRQEGEILGIDREVAGDRGVQVRVSLRTSVGRIAFVDLGAATSIELQDEASRADLAFLHRSHEGRHGRHEPLGARRGERIRGGRARLLRDPGADLARVVSSLSRGPRMARRPR